LTLHEALRADYFFCMSNASLRLAASDVTEKLDEI